MNRPKQRGDCVYCGRFARLTRDHIPPKNLFHRPPSDLITVPCCFSCYDVVSKDDEYFRQTIALKTGVAEDSDTSGILSGIIRSLQQTPARSSRSGVQRDIGEEETRVAGGYLLAAAAMNGADLNRLNAVAARIIRALFYHERGERLAEGYTARVYAAAGFRSLSADTAARLRHYLQWLLDYEPKLLGRVFSYWVGFSPPDPNVSVWALLFYRHAAFIGITSPEGPASADDARPV